MKFKKVVIWGYPLDTHTHSYIHASFYKAFKSLGYDTYWFTDDRYEDIGFDDCLFIAAGEQEKNIPINKKSYYVLHNVDGKKYIDAGCKILVLQVHTKKDESFKSEVINDYTFINKDTINTLYTCWATDLLPSEIDLGLAKNVQNPKKCLWIGTFGDSVGVYQNGTELDPFFNSCKANGIDVIKINPWSSPVSFEQNMVMVNSSYISPTIQGPWQIENEYIPCRIFKNLSYGHMGYVNSPRVNSLFSNELIFSRDTSELFNKSIDFKNSNDHIERLKYLMNEVKEKHTYVNRIKQIIECLPE